MNYNFIVRSGLLLFVLLITGQGFGQSNPWTFSIGLTQGEYAEGMDVNSSGDIYTGGKFMGINVDFKPGVGGVFLSSVGKNDIWLGKYNKDGDHKWAVSMGNVDEESILHTCYDNIGSRMYATGFMESVGIDFDATPGLHIVTNPGNKCAFVLGYKDAGTIDNAWAIGGDDEAEGLGIEVDKSGRLIVSGSVNGSSIDFDPSNNTTNETAKGNMDAFIVSHKVNGDLNWYKLIGKSGSECAAKSVITDGAEKVYVTGYFTGQSVDFNPGVTGGELSSNGKKDVFLARYSKSGTFEWAIGFGGSEDDEGVEVRIDNSGNVILTGNFKSNSLDLNPNGAAKQINNNGGQDILIAQYKSSNGDNNWGHAIGGTGDEEAWSTDANSSGDVFMTGSYESSSITFGGTSSGDDLSNSGSKDIFLCGYNQSGLFKWSDKIGGSSNEEAKALRMDGSGIMYLAGNFGSNNLDFDIGGSNPNKISSAGSRDIFVSTYEELPTGIENPVKTDYSINIYPNPVINNFSFNLSTSIEKVKFGTVFDINGRKVAAVTGDRVEIQEGINRIIGTLPNGIYTLKIDFDKGSLTQKWIKE